MKRNVKILAHCYNDYSQSQVEPTIPIVRNHTWTKYISFIDEVKLVQDNFHLGCDWFGLLSWKLPLKTNIRHSQIAPYINQALFTSDVYYMPLPSNPHHENVWAQGEYCHPGLLALAEEVFASAGLDSAVLKATHPPAFCMYVVAKPLVYEDYVRNWLIPCLQAMQKDPALDAKLSKAIPYSGTTMSHEELFKTFGVDGFTFHAPILERLWPSYMIASGVSYSKIWASYVNPAH